MIPDDWQDPQRLTSAAAVLIAAALLSRLGGMAGLVFGVAAIIAWIASPPVFAFVIAQAGLAAVATPPYSVLVVVTELAVLVLVLSDTTIPWTPYSRILAGGCAGVFAAIIWLNQSLPTWQLATLTVTGATLAIYGAHRYELLTTGQLTPNSRS